MPSFQLKPQKSVPTTIKISADDFSWVSQVQACLKNENANKKIILFAEKEPTNGIIGLVNCIRKEPGGEKTRYC